MVLKRNKSFKNIYKSLIKPGLVINGDSAGGVAGGGDTLSGDGDPLLAPLTPLPVSNSRRPSASAATDVSVFSNCNYTFSQMYKNFLVSDETSIKWFFLNSHRTKKETRRA